MKKRIVLVICVLLGGVRAAYSISRGAPADRNGLNGQYCTACHRTNEDRRDWQFMYGITATDSYDLDAGVRAAFQCLKCYRGELEGLLLERNDDPTFPEVDLEYLLSDRTG